MLLFFAYFLNSFILINLKGSVAGHKILRYKFTVSYITASPDGVWTSNILGINGKFPGPTIEGNLGDTVEVEVINRIQDGQNVSIHWHGIHQRGTPFQDGASHLSQCPLKNGHSQTYRFHLDEPGTYWYHSHVNSQYTEGLWGALIVHSNRYKFVSGDFVITINDWYHTSAHENEKWLWTPETQGVPPYPNSILMDGVGRYPCTIAKRNQRMCSRRRQLRPIFHVKNGLVYRIRVINTSGYAAYNFTIDKHILRCIEVDGVDVKPVEAEAVSIGAGQRYSFLVNFNQTGRTTDRFLIRARLREEFLFTIPNLNINWNPKATFSEVTGLVKYGRISEPIRSIASTEVFDYRRKFPALDKSWSDLNFLQENAFLPLDNTSFPSYYDLELTLNIRFINDQNGMRRGTFNGKPLELSQDKPQLMQMIEGNIPQNNSHIIPVKFGSVVQVVVNNPMLGAHPIHLHGHHFWVMGQGKEGDGAYREGISQLWTSGHRRDTLMVLESSWVVIRFRADNVGIWSLHCHVDWHYITGMSVVFVEGPEMVHGLTIPEETKRVCEDHRNK